jgi:hypothetical protein
MKPTTITYELICKQINELLQNGEKITVRNVIAHTGGQVSRVIEFIKRWREENNIGKLNMDLNISEELQRALLLDKATAITRATTIYKTQIADVETLSQEANEIIKTQELQLIDNIKQLDSITQQVSALCNNEDNYKQNIKILEGKHSADQILCTRLNNDIAKHEIKLENATTTITELKSQLSQQNAELLQITQLKHQAETNSAVWEAKYQQVTEQLESLMIKINQK